MTSPGGQLDAESLQTTACHVLDDPVTARTTFGCSCLAEDRDRTADT